MNHLVLMGDSIIDNASYVPGEPCVTDQVRARLSNDWQVTQLATDGDRVQETLSQLQHLPAGVTHIVISAGGNDALHAWEELYQEVESVIAALEILNGLQARFLPHYHQLLTQAVNTGAKVVVCSIYDHIPMLEPHVRLAIAIYNDVITREAYRFGLPVIDLRVLCEQKADYSALSEIEPSAQGGSKIAAAVVRCLK